MLRTPPALAAAALAVAAGAGAAQPPQEAAAERYAAGRAVHEQVCAACHSLDPPPREAPPVRGVSRQLHRHFDSAEAAVAFVSEYLVAPSAERAVCDRRAIERFGVMPALPLPEAQREDAAFFFWRYWEVAPPPARPGRGTGR